MGSDEALDDIQDEKQEETRGDGEAVESDQDGQGSWRTPRFKGQQILSGVLLGLALLMLLLSLVTVWLETTVLNKSEFVDTVGPLIEDEEVTDAVSRALVAQIFEDVSTEEVLSEELPDLPSFVPTLLDTALEEITLRLTQDLLQTELVSEIWYTAVGGAHEIAGRIISGDTLIQDDEGAVVLDLSPVVERLTEPLRDLGLDLNLDEAIAERDLGKVVLIEDGQLGAVQDAVELLDTLSWFLPAFTVVLLAAAIYLSRRRRSSTLYAAVGVFVLMIVLALMLRISRSFLIDNVKEENQQAVENIWDHVLRRLYGSIIGLAALAIVVFVALWLTGRSSSAVSARAHVADGLDRLRGGRLGELAPEGLDDKIRPRRRAIEVGAVLVTVVILWSQPNLSGTAVVVAAVLLALFLLAVEFFVRPAPRDSGGGDAADESEEGDSGDEDGDSADDDGESGDDDGQSDDSELAENV